jgi:hypothetical protein
MAEPRPAPRPAPRLASSATAPDSAPPAGAAEAEEAWAVLQPRWDDLAAHQAYLRRFTDLDGLTDAGRRYREVLAARPGDAMALAMKAEILKRATVVGLAMLPRTPPPAVTAGKWRRISLILLACWLGSTLVFLAWKLFGGGAP